jgi:hypothetical protein
MTMKWFPDFGIGGAKASVQPPPNSPSQHPDPAEEYFGGDICSHDEEPSTEDDMPLD